MNNIKTGLVHDGFLDSPGGGYDAMSVVGVTEELLAFVKDLVAHPRTWVRFLLPEDADDFGLNDSQQAHAGAVERLIPELGELRWELCPDHMLEGRFWMIYLCCHLDEKPQLVIIKRAGHAVNVEKPKQIYKHIKEFLVDPKQEKMHDSFTMDYAYIATDYAYIATDYAHIATDYAYIATDYAYIATDYAYKSDFMLCNEFYRCQ
ncbi:hypothetical protein QQ045_022239 [Rhodiola kirilowii]